jgi:Flp pilus assembly protein TadB
MTTEEERSVRTSPLNKPQDQSSNIQDQTSKSQEQSQQPSLPRRSVSMETRVLAAAADLAEKGKWEEVERVFFFFFFFVCFVAGFQKMFHKALAALSVAGAEGGSAALCFARGEAREKIGEV